MRDLDYTLSPERHELFSLCLMNELMAARVAVDPVLYMKLPAIEGAEVRLPVPALYSDLLGGRVQHTLNLSELLFRYLDLGGSVKLAVGVNNGKVDAALMRLAHTLMGHSVRADVRAFRDIGAFVVAGEYSAIAASMVSGVFKLDTGIFQYFSGAAEVKRERDRMQKFFSSRTALDWKEVMPQ